MIEVSTVTPWSIDVTLTGPGRLAGRVVTVDVVRWTTAEPVSGGETRERIAANVDVVATSLLGGLTRGELQRLPLEEMWAVLVQIDAAIRADGARRLKDIKQHL